MARGFDTTVGSASTDIISCVSMLTPTLMSFAGWYWRRGDGGLSSGRVFDKTGSAAGEISLRRSSTNMRFTRTWTTTGVWDVSAAGATAASTWIHVVITYDGSSTANNPIFYINGQSVSVTRTTAPAGTITSASGLFTIGNRSTSGTQWDGILGDQAFWSETILSAEEARALFQGADPRTIRPLYLSEHVIMRDGKPWSSVNSTQPTVTGTKFRGDRMLPANDNAFPFGYVAAGGATAVPVFMHHRQMQGMS